MATTAKVNAFVFTPNDSVLFNGGDSFSGCLVFNSTNVPGSFKSNLFTLGSYGSSTKPDHHVDLRRGRLGNDRRP